MNDVRGTRFKMWPTILLFLGLAVGLYLALEALTLNRFQPTSLPLQRPEGMWSLTRTNTTIVSSFDPDSQLETETTTTTIETTVFIQGRTPPVATQQSQFHTLKERDAQFEWAEPMATLPPDQARRFLKEEAGSAWLPNEIRHRVQLRDKAVRVVCVFPFDCEVDLLEVRLMETYDAADYFIIGESNYSQTGQPKRLHFWESRHRFTRFWPKIRHMVYWDGFKDKIEQQDWTNEDLSRHSLTPGLRGLDDDDIILLTDADEIPNYDAIMFYRHYTGGRIHVRWSQMGFFWSLRGPWGPPSVMTTKGIAEQIGTNGIRKSNALVKEWWTLGSDSAFAGCFPYQDFNNKFHNVIEPSWRSGGEDHWPEEAMAHSRYNGVAPVADSGVVLNFEGHPKSAREHFRYLSERDVLPKCGWCLHPLDHQTHPVSHIATSDPTPTDRAELSKTCSNDITLSATPF